MRWRSIRFCDTISNMQSKNKHKERITLNGETIAVPGLQTLGRYRYSAADRGLPIHRHDDGLEICYLERGHQIYRCGGQRFELRGGDCYLTFPNEPHDTAKAPQDKGILYWMVVDYREGQGPLGPLRGEKAGHIREALLSIPRRHFHLGREVKPLLEKLLTAVRGRESFWEIKAGTALIDYLLMVIEIGGRSAVKEPSPLIQDLILYIEGNVEERLTIADLAEHCSLSASRLKNRFRTETGIPPAEFILRKKIDAACRLLEETGRSITEIAMQLGFSSSQYFATVFRRYTRNNPKAHGRAGAAGTDQAGTHGRASAAGTDQAGTHGRASAAGTDQAGTAFRQLICQNVCHSV